MKKKLARLAMLAAGFTGYIVTVTESSAEVSAKGLQVSLNIMSKCRVSGGSPISAYDLIEGSLTQTSVKVNCSSNVPFNVSVAMDMAPATSAAASTPIDTTTTTTTTTMRFYQDQSQTRAIGSAASGQTISTLGRGQPVEISIFGKSATASAEPVSDAASDVMRVTVTY